MASSLPLIDASHLLAHSILSRSIGLNTELGIYSESIYDAKAIAKVFDEKSMYWGYRVLLDDDGDLEWVIKKADGSEIRVDKEPDTTAWQRFSTRFLSLTVPEKEL